MAKLQQFSESPTLKILLMMFMSIAAFFAIKYLEGTEESSKQLVGLVQEQNQSILGLRGDVAEALTAMQIMRIEVDNLKDDVKELKHYHNGKTAFLTYSYSIPEPKDPPKYLINQAAVLPKKPAWM